MTSIWPEIKQKIILPKPDSSDHDVSAHLKINVSPAIIEEKINKKREKKKFATFTDRLFSSISIPSILP